MDRRTWLRDAAAAVAAIPLVSGARRRDAAAGPAQTGEAPRPSEGTPGFFPGFKPFKVAATGATINGVIGGSGPPLLLLHGAPQTHVSWRLVAPKLAESHTVVAADPSSAEVATIPIWNGLSPISSRYAGRMMAANPSPNPRAARAA